MAMVNSGGRRNDGSFWVKQKTLQERLGGVAYLLRGLTRITMRVMMLKKKPRMANRMAL